MAKSPDAIEDVIDPVIETVIEDAEVPAPAEPTKALKVVVVNGTTIEDF